jgi:cell wall-associated NlpC family hydrolase
MPLTSLMTLFLGVLIFTQVTMGGAVDRLRSYAEDEEPDNAGPKGSAFNPRPVSAKGKSTRSKFVRLLLTQQGDDYIFGGETKGEKNPNGYDCSEFIQWAMIRLGFTDFPDGSANQIAHASPISVRRALKMRGAALYRPGHIAISLGNGWTIEARGTDHGVGSFPANGRGWTTGGLFPELA